LDICTTFFIFSAGMSNFRIASSQIVEGAVTIAFGILGWFFLPGFPDRNEFLSDEETVIVLNRVQNDRGDSLPDMLTWTKFIDTFDWRVWAYAFMFLCATISTYGVGYVQFA
jgi:hypothetical protein